MATILYGLRGYEDTAANWASDATIYPLNSLLFATDTGAIKRGDGVSTYAELDLLTTTTPTAWSAITGRPAQIGAGATKEAARTAIAAAAADHVHAVVADVDSGLADAETIQALAIALSTRITDHVHAVEADVESGLAGAETIQALAIALSTRIKVLEDLQDDPA